MESMFDESASYCGDKGNYCGDKGNYCGDKGNYCGDKSSYADDYDDFESFADDDDDTEESFADDYDDIDSFTDDDSDSDAPEADSDSDVPEGSDDESFGERSNRRITVEEQDSDIESSVAGSDNDEEAQDSDIESSVAGSDDESKPSAEAVNASSSKEVLFRPKVDLPLLKFNDISEKALENNIHFQNGKTLIQLKPKDIKNLKHLLSDKNGMIMFYLPQCPHCINALPAFATTGLHLQGSGRMFGILDAESHPETAEMLDIEAFPFMAFLNKGKLDKMYTGDRDVAHLYDNVVRYFSEHNLELPKSVKAK